MRGFCTGKRTHVRMMALQARDYGVIIIMVVTGSIFSTLTLLRLM